MISNSKISDLQTSVFVVKTLVKTIPDKIEQNLSSNKYLFYDFINQHQSLNQVKYIFFVLNLAVRSKVANISRQNCMMYALGIN